MTGPTRSCETNPNQDPFLGRSLYVVSIRQWLAARPRTSGAPALVGVPLLAASWALIWTQDLFWNPVFFWGMWMGAALVMYAAGPGGYPGLRRHSLLALVSIPVWWWFELVNNRVGNWEYINKHDYTSLEYFLLASLAFSTVVPALDSVWRMTLGKLRPRVVHDGVTGNLVYLLEAAVGGIAVVITFGWPSLFFPLAWLGPFLIFDGLVGYEGGHALARDILRGEWRLVAAIGLAGLMCGGLWEFWNFWSTPKWVYHIPYFGFLHVFEMPLLGYLGYVPFAWSVYQLLQLGPLRRYVRRYETAS